MLVVCLGKKKKMPTYFVSPFSPVKLTLLSAENLVSCHKPHSVYSVVISLTLCFVTNNQQQLLGFTELHEMTRSIKSP